VQGPEAEHIELQGADGREWRFTVLRVEAAAQVLRGRET